MSQPEIIHCELCNLIHGRTATICEDCGHRLGTAPDWGALKDELSTLRKRMLLGVVALVAMLAFNWWLLYGGGAILALAPLGWLIFSAYRYRLITKHLKRHQIHRW
jgi:hypothetical protein